jgi:hypothetical protein
MDNLYHQTFVFWYSTDLFNRSIVLSVCELGLSQSRELLGFLFSTGSTSKKVHFLTDEICGFNNTNLSPSHLISHCKSVRLCHKPVAQR